LFRRQWPYFYAFDLLSVDGRDIRTLPLTERKARLHAIMPKVDSRLLYLDGIAGRGRDLFRLACQRDLEGIVAKWSDGTYQTDGRSTSWVKIRNPDYSQIVDRHELFKRRSIEGAARRRFSAPMLDLR
jgi:bifunctional non-homologous end joining protein LigD